MAHSAWLRYVRRLSPWARVKPGRWRRLVNRASSRKLWLEQLEDRTALSTTVLNFDSVDASAGPVDATTYLASYGITLSGVTPGTSVDIVNNNSVYGGAAAVPSSPPNLLEQLGSNDPVSFTLTFASPLDSVSITRIMLIAGGSGITHPQWSAQAFNSLDQQVATVGEPLLGSFSNVPAQTFTMEGPGITSVQFNSNNEHFAAFNGALLDDLTLTVTPPAVAATGGYAVAATEGTLSSSQTVATFTDPGGPDVPANYAATINWGDGNSSPGTISFDSTTGIFTVSGSHDYTGQGGDTITTTITHGGSLPATATSTATVVDQTPVATGGYTFAATEGTLSSSQTVATFTDPGGPDVLGNYTASINWGDGNSSLGTISFDSTTGTFTVSGSYDYAEQGGYTITTTITHDLSSPATALSAATVADVPLIVAAPSFSAMEGQSLNNMVVTTFTDPAGAEPAGNYKATIAWGDGASSTTGAVSLVSGNTFQVAGSHTYAEEGAYSVQVTVQDDGNTPTPGLSGLGNGTLTVADQAPVIYLPPGLTGSEGQVWSGQVAGFSDPGGAEPAGNYKATIDWGDGSNTDGVGSVSLVSGSLFNVTGSHKYVEEGIYTVQVTVQDDGNTATPGLSGLGSVTMTAFDAPLEISQQSTGGGPHNSSGWVTEQPLPTAVQSARAVAIGNLIYVVGGFNGTTDVAGLESYDPTTNTWTSLAPLPSLDAGDAGRYGGAVGVINGLLYVAGGWRTDPTTHQPVPTSSLEVYDPLANAWSTGPSMPIASADSVGGVINGKLYVLTASTGDGSLHSLLYVYDPSGPSWTQLADAPSVHADAAAGVINGLFYVAGGFNSSGASNELDIYDPVANLWSTGPAMPTARWGVGGITVGGQLAVAGGYTASNTPSDLIEVFDTGKNAWKSPGDSGTLTAAYAERAAASLGNVVYVVGGTEGNGPIDTVESLETDGGGNNGQGLTFQATEGTSIGPIVLATVIDTGGFETLSDYAGTIDWGDGTGLATATLVSNPDGSFNVVGSHTYNEEGDYNVNVQVSHEDGIQVGEGPSSAGATEPSNPGSSTSNADVTGPSLPPSAPADGPAVSLGAVPNNLTLTEGNPDNMIVATFSNIASNSDTPGDYTALITWGDGTASTAGMIGYAPVGGGFTVSGTHTYAEEGSYSVGVEITRTTGEQTGTTSTMTVLDASLFVSGVGFTATAGSPTPAGLVVAAFSDQGGAEPVGDYQATIDWGDNSSSPGTIQANGGNNFQVLGSHTYAAQGFYTVNVQIDHENGVQGTAVSSATVNSSNDNGGGNGLTVSASATVTVNDASLTMLNLTPINAVASISTGTITLATFADANPEAQPGDYSATITWGDGTNSNGAIVANPNATFSVVGSHTYPSVGNPTFTVQVQDDGGSSTGGGDPVHVTPFGVQGLSATATGFTLAFSEAIATSQLFLYSALPSQVSQRSVSLIDPNGHNVRGSLLVSGNVITYVLTGQTGALPNLSYDQGTLPTGTYTVILQSGGSDGFTDMSGNPINGSTSPYTTTFSITAPGVELSLPDFARGPGQPINLASDVNVGNNPPANDAGTDIPIRFYNPTNIAQAVSTLTFQIPYNPSLLTITGYAAGNDASGGTISLDTSTTGLALVGFTASPGSIPTAASGGLNLIDLLASVPTDAPYDSKELLDLQNISFNGGATVVADDNAVQTVTYLGDSNDGPSHGPAASSTYNGPAATAILNLTVGGVGGFAGTPMVDPFIVGDILGVGSVGGSDATIVLEASVGQNLTTVPPIPGNGFTVNQNPGPDPTLSIPQFSAAPGATVLVPVELDKSDELDSVKLVLSYDTSRLQLVSGTNVQSDVLPGSLTQGFTFNTDINPKIGTLVVEATSASPLSGAGSGSVAVLAFQVKANAPAGAAFVDLNGGTALGGESAQGVLVNLQLSPAPGTAAGKADNGQVSVQPTATPIEKPPVTPAGVAKVLTVTSVQTISSPAVTTVPTLAAPAGFPGADLVNALTSKNIGAKATVTPPTLPMPTSGAAGTGTGTSFPLCGQTISSVSEQALLIQAPAQRAGADPLLVVLDGGLDGANTWVLRLHHDDGDGPKRQF